MEGVYGWWKIVAASMEHLPQDGVMVMFVQEQ